MTTIYATGGSKLFSSNHETVIATVEAAVKQQKSLDYADLRGVTLQGANLHGAQLQHAKLSGADLHKADLSEADLTGACLRGINLSLAIVHGADFGCVSTEGANIVGMDPRRTKNFRMPTGETWHEYVVETVPALLTAGGKTLEHVLVTGCWTCHSWQNCPMHAAFGAKDLKDVPLLYRPLAGQFIDVFDYRYIEEPSLGVSVAFTDLFNHLKYARNLHSFDKDYCKLLETELDNALPRLPGEEHERAEKLVQDMSHEYRGFSKA